MTAAPISVEPTECGPSKPSVVDQIPSVRTTPRKDRILVERLVPEQCVHQGVEGTSMLLYVCPRRLVPLVEDAANLLPLLAYCRLESVRGAIIGRSDL